MRTDEGSTINVLRVGFARTTTDMVPPAIRPHQVGLSNESESSYCAEPFRLDTPLCFAPKHGAADKRLAATLVMEEPP